MVAGAGGAAAAGAADAILGPLFLPPVDPGQVFLRVLDAWAMGPWCSDETDGVRTALQYCTSRNVRVT